MMCSVFEALLEEEMDLAAMILWCLWFQRNEFLWNNKHFSNSAVVRLIASMFSQWVLARSSGAEGTGNGGEGIEAFVWLMPSLGYMKIMWMLLFLKA
ncbi:hypothetical protein LguiB_005015 [Lonicera macranthoides]